LPDAQAKANSGIIFTTSVVTTSYYLGGKLVAQRENTTLRYIHQDSLYSTSVMTTSTGTLDSSIVYMPFGDCRNSQPGIYSVHNNRSYTSGARLDGSPLTRGRQLRQYKRYQPHFAHGCSEMDSHPVLKYGTSFHGNDRGE
jgi:hypothetical protein